MSSYKLCKSACVLGAGESFLKIVKSEAVVHALVEYSADIVVALEDEYFIRAVFGGGKSGCKARRASADNYYVVIFFVHHFTSLVSPVRM